MGSRGGRSLSPSSSFFFPLSPHHRRGATTSNAAHAAFCPSPPLSSSFSLAFFFEIFFLRPFFVYLCLYVPWPRLARSGPLTTHGGSFLSAANGAVEGYEKAVHTASLMRRRSAAATAPFRRRRSSPMNAVPPSSQYISPSSRLLLVLRLHARQRLTHSSSYVALGATRCETTHHARVRGMPKFSVARLYTATRLSPARFGLARRGTKRSRYSMSTLLLTMTMVVIVVVVVVRCCSSNSSSSSNGS